MAKRSYQHKEFVSLGEGRQAFHAEGTQGVNSNKGPKDRISSLCSRNRKSRCDVIKEGRGVT